MSTYMFDQTWQQERQRLASLEVLFDDTSQRHLTRRGLQPGWRCLEVGCGGGSLALWLADQVGPTGSVLATDLDTRFIQQHGRANLEVRTRNLVTDPLEADTFDLAHAWAVLEHIPRREQALANLVAAVRPGGWVVVEDVDVGGPALPALVQHVLPREQAPLYERMLRAIAMLYTHVGGAADLGARLPMTLIQAGLGDVAAEVHAQLLRGGRQPTWVSLTFEQVQPRLVGAGLLDRSEVDGLLRLFMDPDFGYPTPFMVTAWGQRPAGG
jgi:2-polyprenyl-3-methyl-5-hydroxy-6-metoxy-1,4-benzoquinol methylase